MSAPVLAVTVDREIMRRSPASAKLRCGRQTAATGAGDLKARLVAFAHELGFDACRVTACTPPAHAKEFRDWLNEGAHGEMEYMARGAEKRRDPQKVLPGTKSVIVLALNYFQGDAPHSGAATGRIARYAWGDDYHNVIKAKLRKIDN